MNDREKLINDINLFINDIRSIIYDDIDGSHFCNEANEALETTIRYLELSQVCIKCADSLFACEIFDIEYPDIIQREIKNLVEKQLKDFAEKQLNGK